MKRSGRWWRILGVAAANALVVCVLLGGMEAVLIGLLNYPPRFAWTRRALSGYYTDLDRAIIQFLPDCARYDTELGYTLRPGSCRFRNREFDTVVAVNSAGLRDSESALAAPEIVVLGDSFAMGWGVEGQDAFPRVLEQACGAPTLNAAISSYGTAREARLLERVNRNALRWLVVQYCDNDQAENAAFVSRGDRLVPMRESEYRRLQDEMVSRSRYFPGKHLIGFLPHLGSRLAGRVQRTERPDPAGRVNAEAPSMSESQLFLHALQSGPSLPADVRVIVVEINGAGQNDGEFAAALRQELAQQPLEEPWRSMTVLDIAPSLSPDQFMALDEHLTPAGHQTVALALARAMGCRP